MKNLYTLASVGAIISVVAVPVAAQEAEKAVEVATKALETENKSQPTAKTSVTLPADTIIVVTPSEGITSKKMKEGSTRRFQVAQEVKQDGVVVIPRGAPVIATVQWRTGKGIVGKSAKFELSFDSVKVVGRQWALKGMHRQEGRGNTAGALLGAGFITGRSATMTPGQLVNVFTAEDIVIK